MNNETFLIEDSDLDFAKEICKYIEDPSLRERAVANSISANIAKKYFENQNVDVESGLHNVARVLEDIEISDIYINGSHIGVRLYFDESEMCVPKSHFDNNIVPLAYMFIQINSELTGGTVTGFITPSQINRDICHNGYYKVEENELISYYDIEPLLVNEEEAILPDDFSAQIFNYLDNKLKDKASFYQILTHSKEGKERLAKAANAQNVFRFVSITKTENNITDSQELTVNDEELLTDENDEIQGSDDFNLDVDDSAEILEDFNISDTLEESLVPDDSLEPIEETAMLDEFEPMEQNNISSIDDSFTDNTEELAESNSSFEDIATPEIILEEDNVTPSTTIDDTLQAEADALTTPLEIVEDVEITSPIEDYVPNINQVDSDTSDNTLDIVEDGIDDTVNEEEQKSTSEISQNKDEEVLYSTTTTPSISSVEEEDTDTDTDTDAEVLESMLEASDKIQETESDNDTEPNSQIDELFGQEQHTQSEEDDEKLPDFKPAKQKSGLLPILGIVAVIAALGYFGYNKYVQNQSIPEQPVPEALTTTPPLNKSVQKTDEAMPIETVENVETIKSEEGNSVSIPAIEQNLDASILVSNLSVSWEVPSGYVSNNTAKRYFTKLGKIIQLNLKTELLLLSKPPITNRISVELEFNKNTQRFDIKGITASSGEKVVDDVITKTVKNALDMNLNINMSTFGNIQGNPVLMIRL